MVGFQSVLMRPRENRKASIRVHAEILIHDLHEVFIIKSSPDGFGVGDGFQTLERRQNAEEGFTQYQCILGRINWHLLGFILKRSF